MVCWDGKVNYSAGYYYYYYLLLESFFTSALIDGLSLKFKREHVSRTLLSILAVLNKAVVWMVSTSPIISKSSSPFNNHSVSVPRAPITTGIIVTLMFHVFSSIPYQGQSTYPFFHFFFQFYFMVSRDIKVHNFSSSLFFLLIIIRSGRLAEIRWSVCMLKVYESLSPGQGECYMLLFTSFV